MSLLKEFKDFALRGNVVDLAVGVIIGAAFAPIVTSLVADIIMPPIGWAISGINFSDLAFKIPTGDPTKPVNILYGKFLNAAFSFTVTAFAIFLLVKVMNTLKKKEAETPPKPTKSEELLGDILKELRVKR